MNTRETLVAAYCQMYPELVRLANQFVKNRDQVEDLVQDLYINFDRVEATRLINNPKEFIKTSLYNRCLNWNTTKNRRVALVEKLGVEAGSYYPSASSFEQLILESNYQRLDLVAEFTNTLKPTQRAIFVQLLEGSSITEITKKQKSTYNTVKHNRRLLIQKLKTFFAANGEEFTYDKIQSQVPRGV